MRERERGHGYKKICVTFKRELSHHVSCDSRGLESRRIQVKLVWCLHLDPGSSWISLTQTLWTKQHLCCDYNRWLCMSKSVVMLENLVEISSHRESKYLCFRFWYFHGIEFELIVHLWYWEKYWITDHLKFIYTHRDPRIWKTQYWQSWLVLFCVCSRGCSCTCTCACTCAFVCVILCYSTINNKVKLVDQREYHGVEGQVCLTMATNSTSNFVVYRWVGTFVCHERSHENLTIFLLWL